MNKFVCEGVDLGLWIDKEDSHYNFYNKKSKDKESFLFSAPNSLSMQMSKLSGFFDVLSLAVVDNAEILKNLPARVGHAFTANFKDTTLTDKVLATAKREGKESSELLSKLIGYEQFTNSPIFSRKETFEFVAPERTMAEEKEKKNDPYKWLKDSQATYDKWAEDRSKGSKE